MLEANYTRFVQEMRSRGVQYVTMVADFQNIVRLQKAMKQQGYIPKVRDWDSVAYDPDYLKEGDAVEGSYIFLNNAMFEEATSNPEMKLYTEWLQRAVPGRDARLLRPLRVVGVPPVPEGRDDDRPRPHAREDARRAQGDEDVGRQRLARPPPDGGQAADGVQPVRPGEGREVRPLGAGVGVRLHGSLLAMSVAMKDFLAFTIIGIVTGSIYAVAASGLVLTYTTSGIFNFAHGGIGMFMAFIVLGAALPPQLARAARALHGRLRLRAADGRGDRAAC